MKILVIGGGGREHAIITSLNKSKNVEKIYAMPGNGGIAKLAQCVPIGATEIDKQIEFAKANNIDFAVIAPDDPLVLGAVDAFEKAGIPCFGPNKDAAIIEGSKAFSKELMKKYKIPTADYEVFNNSDDAIKYINKVNMPIVIKADGLALGKGVIIAQNKEEAVNAIVSIMEDKKFGKSGNKIVIEEFLEGMEVSVLSFTDGNIVVPMISSMDHKRALDGDLGLNTGGMGTIAPNPYYSEEISKVCQEKIFEPTIKAMKKENRTFKGCLYFGLILTKNGPKVIEYNCRFGDPETQVVLPLLKSDLLDIMIATRNGTLKKEMVEFEKNCTCCVIMASKGYPVSYKKGYEIDIPEDLKADVYIAGAKLNEDKKLVTSGGRVLGVVGKSHSLYRAIVKAYENVQKVHFENEYYRNDIGKKALQKKIKL